MGKILIDKAGTGKMAGRFAMMGRRLRGPAIVAFASLGLLTSTIAGCNRTPNREQERRPETVRAQAEPLPTALEQLYRLEISHALASDSARQAPPSARADAIERYGAVFNGPNQVDLDLSKPATRQLLRGGGLWRAVMTAYRQFSGESPSMEDLLRNFQDNVGNRGGAISDYAQVALGDFRFGHVIRIRFGPEEGPKAEIQAKLDSSGPINGPASQNGRDSLRRPAPQGGRLGWRQPDSCRAPSSAREPVQTADRASNGGAGKIMDSQAAIGRSDFKLLDRPQAARYEGIWRNWKQTLAQAVRTDGDSVEFLLENYSRSRSDSGGGTLSSMRRVGIRFLDSLEAEQALKQKLEAWREDSLRPGIIIRSPRTLDSALRMLETLEPYAQKLALAKEISRYASGRGPHQALRAAKAIFEAGFCMDSAAGTLYPCGKDVRENARYFQLALDAVAKYGKASQELRTIIIDKQLPPQARREKGPAIRDPDAYRAILKELWHPAYLNDNGAWRGGAGYTGLSPEVLAKQNEEEEKYKRLVWQKRASA
ncbi:MAG: hypothetical protein KGH63_02750 [Candidatus Micrarchaeota archaeon]|nr:hypothetical protein [Candidatus Micrarchaeota archaeon]